MSAEYVGHGIGQYNVCMPKYSLRTRAKSNKVQTFTAAEFFAGIGLVRLALELLAWRVVFANDIDPDKQELYEQNFGPGHFRLGDIHQLNPSEIPRCDL